MRPVRIISILKVNVLHWKLTIKTIFAEFRRTPMRSANIQGELLPVFTHCRSEALPVLDIPDKPLYMKAGRTYVRPAFDVPKDLPRFVNKFSPNWLLRGPSRARVRAREE